MRWIGVRKASCLALLSLATSGMVVAQDRLGPPPEATPPPATTRLVAPIVLEPDAPERTGPPLALPPLRVEDVPAAVPVELNGPPPLLPSPPPFAGTRTTNVGHEGIPRERGPLPRIVEPVSRKPTHGLLPPPPPMSVLAAPPSLLPPPASPGGGKDPKEKPDTDNAPEAFNPWKDIPPVQAFPRLGMFLVPGNGPGTYSLCEHEAEFVREKPPAFPYPPFALQPPSGFDADFRYLDRPDNTQHDYFDLLRRMRPHPDTMLTLGGQASVRHMHESDARLTELNTQYWLFRTRGWADVWYQDKFRLYGEFISALIRHNDLPPLPIDENQFDALNLFAELKVAEFGGNPAYVRVGRQELLFGSQRLVSTLDWANTRRTFEGVRGYWRSEGFDVDAFWTRPVEIRPSEFDRADMNVQFYGAWATLRPAKGQFMDVYYLGLTDERPVRDRFLPEGEVPRGTQEYHTFGARYAGNQGPFLYDFEGMLQCGQYVNRVHHAYAYTASVGWEFQNVRWRPQAWIGYDYASGTSNPAADGKSRTFNQLFAFGHYYFGYLDLVGRRNVEDLSLQLAAYPEHWITLVAQCHHFRLAQSRDSLYNAAGIPTRRSPTGEAGRDVGTEVDLLANIHLSAHSDLLVGYSRLFAGDFIRQTGADVSPQLVYAMYNYRW